jgi:Zn-dependent protease with chaperone function
MNNKRFIGLSPEIYQHPSDRKALTSLEKMPGLSLLLKKVNEYGIDRLLRMQTLGSEFKVTPRNFPKLHNAFVETCNILCVNPSPELYLFQGTGHIHTYAIGVEKPIIGVNLETMEWLTSEELCFVLGHELIRVKGGYINYQQIGQVMPLVKGLISSTTLGLGGIAANGIEVALQNWTVMSKFTADRAGLFACQDVDVAVSTLMKLGGLPAEYLNADTIDDFEDQARSFMTTDLDNLDRFTQVFSFLKLRHPWAVMRMAELFKWIDSGEYKSLLETGKLPQKAKEPDRASASVNVSNSSNTSNSSNSSDWDFLANL